MGGYKWVLPLQGQEQLGRGSWGKSFSQGSRPGQGTGRTLIEGKEHGKG